MMIRHLLLAASTCVLSFAPSLKAQVVVPEYQVTIDYNISETGNPDTYFRLVGQSAYMQFRTDGSTSGGQLDFTTGPGNGNIVYTEVFPPPGLSNFLTFAYFGLVETRSSLDDSVIDTSFVMALTPIGQSQITFQDFFPSFTESEVVTALSTTFDSAEFFTLLGEVPGVLGGTGNIGLPELAVPGESMDLVAFLGGGNGDEKVIIGTLATTVAVIPEPATPVLAALAALPLLRRRRESLA